MTFLPHPLFIQFIIKCIILTEKSICVVCLVAIDGIVFEGGWQVQFRETFLFKEVGTLSLDLLNDEFLLELGHFTDDFFLAWNLPFEPRMISDRLYRWSI